MLGSIGDLYRDRLPFVLDVAHTYGDVVQYRVAHMRMYQVNHPAGVGRLLHDNHRNYSKDVATFGTLRLILGNGLFTSDGDFWRRQRRLAQPAFHRRRVAAFGDLMTDATLAMLERWRPSMAQRQPPDVATEFTHLTLEVATRALLSTSVEPDVDAIGTAITTLLNEVTSRFTFPFYPPLRVPTPRNRRFLAARATLDGVIYGIIAGRRRRPSEHDDLLALLMEARDEETGEGISDRQLRDEVITLFLAGHETTANALTWATYLLSTHVAIARKLHSEVDEMLQGRIPTAADLPNLPYMRMVVNDSLRLYPPAWITNRRAIQADTICGYRIPADAIVSMSPYVTHRDPTLWENPEGFDPVRFAPERPAALRVLPVRRWTTPMHRQGLRANGGDARARHAGATLRTTSRARKSSRNGGHGHTASALRRLDDGPPALNAARMARETMRSDHVPLWSRPKASPKGEQAEYERLESV